MQGEDGADVRVLEFDRPLRPASQQAPEAFVMRRLVDLKPGELVAQHGEVVADGCLDFLT
jgi:hypothetical protein